MTEQQIFPDPTDIWQHIDAAMVRDPKDYTFTLPNPYDEDFTMLDEIQLGAGFKHLAGWRNLEYPQWDADFPIPANGYVAGQFSENYPLVKVNKPEHFSAADMIAWALESESARPFIQADNSVAQIASYHTLDHLSPTQVVNTLREVERVLAPGGTFTNIVPHFDSTLAKECIWHQSRFGIDTFRNIFSERQYSHDGSWSLSVGLNFIFGLAERNTVLVTQLVKK